PANNWSTLLAKATTDYWATSTPNSNIEFTQTMSCEMWVKFTTLTTDQALASHAALYPGQIADYKWLFQFFQNKKLRLICYHNDAAPAVSIWERFTNGGSNEPTGTWAHYGFTLDLGQAALTDRCRFYKNGSYLGANTVTAGGSQLDLVDASSIPLRVGGSITSGNEFDGRIDEFRLWSDVRSDGEISTNYNTHIDATTAGLVAYYRFEEGSGTSVADQTSSNNDLGVGSGSPSFSGDTPFA
ncbi:MAG: LamG domain-containing protein, partial [Gemmatimonadota bacterium]